MRPRYILSALLLFVAPGLFSQTRHAGTAIVTIGDDEYMIPIECNDASKPELGFSTEPARITKETTGRTSGLRLTVRPWQDTEELVVSLDKYVAWVPSKPATAGILEMSLDMSPASSPENGVPVTLTHDRWMAGDRPAGLENVSFEANCGHRDPAAPAYRKLADGEA